MLMRVNLKTICSLTSYVLLLCTVSTARQAGQQVLDKGGPASKAASDSAYVGADTCKTCHEEVYDAWEKTPHWKTMLNKGTPSKQGCEGCHGPGAEHVAGGGDKSKIYVFEGKSREETSERCLTCHSDSRAQGHFPQSAHASSDVGCLDCHSPHHAQEKEFLLARKQPDLCYGCHTTEKADFAKPFHHRVNEGLVQCNDCHNPHGTGTLRQVRALPSGDAVCFKCHADKQGPFEI